VENSTWITIIPCFGVLAIFILPLLIPMDVYLQCLGVGMFFMPHSPRWLVEHGRKDEALQTLSRLRRKPAGDRSVVAEFLEITADVRYTREVTDAAFPNAGIFRLWSYRKRAFFTTRKMVKRLFVGGLPLTFQQNMVGA
jgi:hypothetical protein